MTRDDAEEIYMAWQVGFEHDRGKIAMALAILGSCDEAPSPKNPAGEKPLPSSISAESQSLLLLCSSASSGLYYWR